VRCNSKVFPHVCCLRRALRGSALLCSALTRGINDAAVFALCYGLRTCSTPFCHWASTPGSRPAPGLHRRTSSPVSYGAAWTLPRPDLHRLVWSSFAGRTKTENLTWQSQNQKQPHELTKSYQAGPS